MPAVLIIGAGLSGLVAAHELVNLDHSVLVIDKGRSVGGRLATRRIGGATLDHGAQFFTARSDEFRAQVEHWLTDGVIAEWCQGFSEPDGYPRYRAEGGMNQLARHLSHGLDIITGVRAQAAIAGPEAWTITYHGGVRGPDDAAAILSTAPVPQTLEILDAGPVPLGTVNAGLRDLRYHKVIALLMTVRRSPDLGPVGGRQTPDDPDFSFIADNQAKGISTETALTFHTSHQRSAELWDRTDAEVRDVLMPLALDASGLTGADLETVQIKKWRYSGPVEPWPERCAVVAITPGPLVLAGDAFGGPKVEGAFLSGRAAARTMSDLLTS
jgi:renalase